MPLSSLQDLEDELRNDPDGLGYQTHIDSGNHAELSALINARSANYSAFRPSIPMGEVYGEVDWDDEWLGLTAIQRAAFRQITSTETLDAGSVHIREAFQAIFPTGGTTIGNLTNLVQRDASRAEDLWGVNTTISVDQITEALSS